MKHTLLICLAVLFAAMVAMADVPPPPAASQAEVNAGVVRGKFVSPATLAGWQSNSAFSSLTDTNVAAFCRAVNIVNLDDQLRLAGAVSDAKANGLWPLIADIRFLQPCYNAQSNLSFYLKSYAVTNPYYNGQAFVQEGTNYQFGDLPTVITNQQHTFVIARRASIRGRQLASIDALSLYDKWPQYHFMGGLSDTNSSAGVYLSSWYQQGATWEHTGDTTNWIYTHYSPGAGANSNTFARLCWNGVKLNDSWSPSLSYQVLVHSTSNNLHQTWANGNPNVYNIGATATKTYVSTINCTNPLSRILIGGFCADYTNVTKYSEINLAIPPGTATVAGGSVPYSGIAQGEETFMVVVLKTNATQDIADKVTQFCMKVQPGQFWVSGGTSMLNPGATSLPQIIGDGGGAIAGYTNSLLLMNMSAHPEDICIDYASPGSRTSYLTYAPNDSQGHNLSVAGITSFPLNCFTNLMKAGKSVNFLSDCGNDINDYAPLVCATNYEAVFGNFKSIAGVGPTSARMNMICYLRATPGLGGGNTLLTVSNTWVLNSALTKSMMPDRFVTIGLFMGTNEIASASTGFAHLDTTNYGVPLLMQEVKDMRGELTAGYYNPTNATERWNFGTVLPPSDSVTFYQRTNLGSSVGYKLK